MAQLQFKGKTFVQNHHLLVKYHDLVPIKSKSLPDKVSLNDNLIIHGDNLAALKALLPLYAGKIKCVYIDPPYNTGNEKWVYNDNVNSPMMQEWLGKVVDREDLTRHDKWLCMMMPRLKLLRELLREDGLIVISMDDNEIHHLRSLLDEIFNEKNFVSSFIWNTEGHTDNQYHIKVNHEYALVYIKNEAYKDRAIGYVIDPNTRRESNLWRGYAENSITKNGPGNPPSEVTLSKNFPCAVEELDLDTSNVAQEFFDEVAKQGYISREITAKYKLEYPIRKDKLVIKDFKLARDCRVYSGWANVKKLKKFIENGFEPIEPHLFINIGKTQDRRRKEVGENKQSWIRGLISRLCGRFPWRTMRGNIFWPIKKEAALEGINIRSKYQPVHGEPRQDAQAFVHSACQG